jgi:ubiquinone/menaquinone biosynthesis C-methylase UbiE
LAASQGEVLDVGCGTGALTFAIAQNPAVPKIIGIDLSEAFLAYARSKIDDPRIQFEQGDARELRAAPVKNGLFEIVFEQADSLRGLNVRL